MATRDTPLADDNFDRGGPELGANWAQVRPINGDIVIDSSTRAGGAGTSGVGSAAARWVGAGTFTGAQYVKATVPEAIDNLSSGYWAGVLARVSAGVNTDRDFYFAIIEYSGSPRWTRVGKFTSNTGTVLASTQVSWVASDTIALEVEGNALRVYRNDVEIGALTTTDPDLSAGQPGLILSGGVYLDDFSAGNLIEATTPTITEVSPSSFVNGATGIVITGTNFGAAQGTNGRVWISPTNNIADAGRVAQTVTNWAAGGTSITFTAVKGSLGLQTNLYLFVTTDASESTTSSIVQIAPMVYVRETLIDLTGAPLASMTGITALVWHAEPTTGDANPDQVLVNQTTNGSGVTDWQITAGALNTSDPVWIMLLKSGSPYRMTARRITPVYE